MGDGGQCRRERGATLVCAILVALAAAPVTQAQEDTADSETTLVPRLPDPTDVFPGVTGDTAVPVPLADATLHDVPGCRRALTKVNTTGFTVEPGDIAVGSDAYDCVIVTVPVRLPAGATRVAIRFELSAPNASDMTAAATRQVFDREPRIGCVDFVRPHQFPAHDCSANGTALFASGSLPDRANTTIAVPDGSDAAGAAPPVLMWILQVDTSSKTTAVHVGRITMRADGGPELDVTYDVERACVFQGVDRASPCTLVDDVYNFTVNVPIDLIPTGPDDRLPRSITVRWGPTASLDVRGPDDAVAMPAASYGTGRNVDVHLALGETTHTAILLFAVGGAAGGEYAFTTPVRPVLVDTVLAPVNVTLSTYYPMVGIVALGAPAILSLAEGYALRRSPAAMDSARRAPLGRIGAALVVPALIVNATILAWIAGLHREMSTFPLSPRGASGITTAGVVSAALLVALSVTAWRRIGHARRIRDVAVLEGSEQRRRAQELQTLLQGVGHDLKTPLLAMSWLTDSLADDIRSSDPQQVDVALARLRRNVAGMEAMVADLAELSRADSIEDTPEPVDLQEVVGRVIDSVSGAAAAKQVELRPDPSFPTIAGHRTLLSSMLHNLVTNAIKYGPEGGTVTLRARPADADTSPPAGWRIEVEDQGPGIPDHEKGAVFELFHRTSDAQASGIEGTGLGLTLVARVAKAHGGTAHIEDAPVGGARVVVTLPAEPHDEP